MVRSLLPSCVGVQVSFPCQSTPPGAFWGELLGGCAGEAILGRPAWQGGGAGLRKHVLGTASQEWGRDGSIWVCESPLRSCFLLPGLNFPICKTEVLGARLCSWEVIRVSSTLHWIRGRVS